jgi:hypothetical protein
MNSGEEFSDNEFQILDIILNFEPVTTTFLLEFRMHEDITLSTETLNEILDKLSKHQLVTIVKEQYQTVITINANSRNIVREILEGYWKRNNINELTLRADAEKNLLGILKLLEFRYDDKPHIGFSDYFWDSDSIAICKRLAQARLLFRHTWSSRKHSYESYYLRKFPFDVGKSLEQLTIEKISNFDRNSLISSEVRCGKFNFRSVSVRAASEYSKEGFYLG